MVAKNHKLGATLNARQVVTPKNTPSKVPAAVSKAKGTFAGKLDSATGKLTWWITYTGVGNPTLAIAEIHSGPPGKFGQILVRVCSRCKSGQSGVVKVKALAQGADGYRVQCAVGAFVVLNDDGWILAAGRLLEPATLHAAHRAEIAEHEARAQEIAAGDGAAKGRVKRVRSLGANRGWVRNYSFWTGGDGRGVAEFHVVPGADLALGRLEPYDAFVESYPVIRDPATLVPARASASWAIPSTR